MVALRLWVRFIVNIDHYPPICIRMYIYRRADIAEKAHGWDRYYIKSRYLLCRSVLAIYGLWFFATKDSVSKSLVPLWKCQV